MQNEIFERRALTHQERNLIQWLLEHGTAAAKPLLEQLPKATVYSRCDCGCASIDLAINGCAPDHSGPMQIVSDFQSNDADGNPFGLFVFARNGVLAGLEAWPIDGNADISQLPEISSLVPLEIAR